MDIIHIFHTLFVHELEEAASDPQLNGWKFSNGDENADRCAWTIGPLLLNVPNFAKKPM